MIVSKLSDLPTTPEQAIIINYNTRTVATLALLSSLRYVGMPVLLIDCQSNDGSWEHFRRLESQFDFALYSAPLTSHGRALDTIFAQIPAHRLLLIDSDIEVLNAASITKMRQSMQENAVFGSGFVHGGEWMHTHKQPYGYYVERCWIPFCLFDVALVKEALRQGYTFEAETILNEFPPNLLVSKLLIKRFRIPLFRNIRLSWLDVVRKEYHGIKPAFITYDTGAKLYQYLIHKRGLNFVALPWSEQEQSLVHFHGVTRLIMNKRDRHGASIHEITPAVERRLFEEYRVEA